MKLLPSQHKFFVHHTTLHHVTSCKATCIHKVHASLAVTCHLHFWQNGRDLLRATAVTWGVERIPKWVSTESQPWRRKFSHCSCRDSNPWHCNHESGALTTELSPPPGRGGWRKDVVNWSSQLELKVKLKTSPELRCALPWFCSQGLTPVPASWWSRIDRHGLCHSCHGHGHDLDGCHGDCAVCQRRQRTGGAATVRRRRGEGAGPGWGGGGGGSDGCCGGYCRGCGENVQSVHCALSERIRPHPSWTWWGGLAVDGWWAGGTFSAVNFLQKEHAERNKNNAKWTVSFLLAGQSPVSALHSNQWLDSETLPLMKKTQNTRTTTLHGNSKPFLLRWVTIRSHL